ncbi:uncharacterized protein BT62DRAFT_1078530 [Guyanagaster necrorhizus]|uniref:Uncharacterized protein n=1 Tax=Guyanagaster necrorhizus TaxID=856835 RepID=A0A9P7VP57_9AGAR|nr:uncharacterized protein BT62DRAFT_1078530 [Guyanagaster necrorhizus MCA 3950]KAG7443471.1 hypothetical protein BT62DRAFT_1078530 [Guyanagaster necrorhizus MCA 3950]
MTALGKVFVGGTHGLVKQQWAHENVLTQIGTGGTYKDGRQALRSTYLASNPERKEHQTGTEKSGSSPGRDLSLCHLELSLLKTTSQLTGSKFPHDAYSVRREGGYRRQVNTLQLKQQQPRPESQCKAPTQQVYAVSSALGIMYIIPRKLFHNVPPRNTTRLVQHLLMRRFFRSPVVCMNVRPPRNVPALSHTTGLALSRAVSVLLLFCYEFRAPASERGDEPSRLFSPLYLVREAPCLQNLGSNTLTKFGNAPTHINDAITDINKNGFQRIAGEAGSSCSSAQESFNTSRIGLAPPDICGNHSGRLPLTSALVDQSCSTLICFARGDPYPSSGIM